MFRLAFGSLAFVAVSAAASVASATEAGPWIEGRAGAGISSGHFEYEGEYFEPKTGQTVRFRDEGGPFGVAIALGAVGGYALNRQFALGLTGRIELAPYLDGAHSRYASIDMHMLWAVGSTFAFRPVPSLELRIAPEWAFASFAGSNAEIGAADNVFEFEGVNGPGLGFSLGYVSEPGWGFSTAANVVALSGERTTLTALSFTLLASYSTW